MVRAGDKSGAGSWTGDQRVSAHARTLVVLKIYNPVRAYGATGFKSRPLPAGDRFNTFRGNKTSSQPAMEEGRKRYGGGRPLTLPGR